MGEDEWPFSAWLRVAVLQMHLTPNAFWAMSLRDWLALCKPAPQRAAGQGDLVRLMKLFPDRGDSDERS